MQIKQCPTDTWTKDAGLIEGVLGEISSQRVLRLQRPPNDFLDCYKT